MMEVAVSPGDNNLKPIPIRARSLRHYLNVYDKFEKWLTEKKLEITENTVMQYFQELLALKKHPSTVCSIYSQLKCIIYNKHHIDLGEFKHLKDLLKENSKGAVRKRSKFFTQEQVDKFMNEAPDKMFLAAKVVLLFGIHGRCTNLELTNILIDDLECHNNLIIVKLPDRKFILDNEYVKFVQKYQRKRPKNVVETRFFLKYNQGKFFSQPMGRNMIARLTKRIAQFLKLPNFEEYNNHCLRHTSINLLNARKKQPYSTNTIVEENIEVAVENEQPCFNNTSTSSEKDTDCQSHYNLVNLYIKPEVLDYEDYVTSNTEATADYQSANKCDEDSDSSNESMESFDIQKRGKTIPLSSVTKKQYLRAYAKFRKWLNVQGLKCITESVLLTYFEDLLEKGIKPTSLWHSYSMLKATILTKHQINMKGYTQLLNFLKTESKGFVQKKWKVFTEEQIAKFIKQAPNEKYLVTKVALVLCIVGGCRNKELAYLTIDNVQYLKNNTVLVKIIDKSSKVDRQFVLDGEDAELVRLYQSHRSDNVTLKRFFLRSQCGKLINLPIGINQFRVFPGVIARYLKLRNPERYSCVSYRRIEPSLSSRNTIEYTNSDSEFDEAAEVTETATQYNDIEGEIESTIINTTHHQHETETTGTATENCNSKFQTPIGSGHTQHQDWSIIETALNQKMLSGENPEQQNWSKMKAVNDDYRQNTLSETNSMQQHNVSEGTNQDVEILINSDPLSDLAKYEEDINFDGRTKIVKSKKRTTNFKVDKCENDDNDYESESDDVSDGSIDLSCDINLGNKSISFRSKKTYIYAFNSFQKWRIKKKYKSITERILLEYFKMLKEKNMTPITIFYKLYSTIKAKYGIDLKKFTKLVAFVKNQQKDITSKKIKIFTKEQVEKFIEEAPDEKYLAVKVALIFGVFGGCRNRDLKEINVDNVQHHDDIILVKIPDTRTNCDRKFVVDNKYIKFIRKYESYRPKNSPLKRYFFCFRDKKGVNQPIAANTFGLMPGLVAKYLKLPNPNLYTCSFRRTAAYFSLAEPQALGYANLRWANKRKVHNLIKESDSQLPSPCKKSKIRQQDIALESAEHTEKQVCQIEIKSEEVYSENSTQLEDVHKSEYESVCYQHYNPDERIQGCSMEEWLKLSVSLTDFRNDNNHSDPNPSWPWDEGSGSVESHKRCIRALFEMMSKLHIKYWTAYDTDIVPRCDTWEEEEALWEEMTQFVVELSQQYRVQLMWLAPDLHSDPRYGSGALTSRDVGAVCAAATQLKRCVCAAQRCGAPALLVCAGAPRPAPPPPPRAPPRPRAHTDPHRERALLANMLLLTAQYKDTLNYRCQLLLMPDEAPPRECAYMWDAASCLYLLKTHDLERHYKVCCYPGHHQALASAYGMLGGVFLSDEPEGGERTGLALMMKSFLEQGCGPAGGVSLRARARGGGGGCARYARLVDTAARALRDAEVLQRDARAHVQQRYVSYSSGFGARLLTKDVSLDDCEEYYKTHGAHCDNKYERENAETELDQILSNSDHG